MHQATLAAILTPVLASALLAAADTGWKKAPQVDLTDAQVQDIIAKFAAKEAAFARARENYTYRQTVKVQELDPDGTPTGKHEIVEDVIFTPDGKRTEHVVRAPLDTLKYLQLTPEDEQDLRNVQPFVLTTDEIPKYYIRYLGRQMADEIPAYVFAVKPKRLEKGQRYFEGEIWVDDRDLQIVKTYGRGVGIVGKNNMFPKFETYRGQVDGKYWFPIYTHADDTLNFPQGPPQRMSMLVTYKNYKQFKSEVNIQYGDAVSDQPKSAEPPKPAK
jgi:hypothetical protein